MIVLIASILPSPLRHSSVALGFEGLRGAVVIRLIDEQVRCCRERVGS